MADPAPVKISSLTDFPGQMQDGGFIPLDDGANAYRFTPRRMADYTVGSAASYAAGLPGAIARTAKAKLSEVVSVLDFGAVADGVKDNTSAFQAALDTGRSVLVPCVPKPGVAFRIAGTLRFKASGQQMFGHGFGPSGSRVEFDNGAADCILIGETNATLNEIAVRNIQFIGTKKTAGRFAYAEGASRVLFEDLMVSGFMSGIEQGPNCNTMRIHRVHITGMRGGPNDFAIAQTGIPGIGQADIMDISQCSTGPDTGARAGRPTTLLIRGGRGSLAVYGLRSVSMGRGVWITDHMSTTSGTASNIYFFNCGVDFPEYESWRFDYGTSVFASNSYLFGSQNADGIYIGEKARSISIHGGKCSGNFLNGIAIHGYEISVSNPNIGQNSGQAIGTLDGIRIGPTAKSVTVTGGQSGRSAGSSGRHRNGVRIDAGATYVVIAALGLEGNIGPGIVDDSGIATIVGCPNYNESHINGVRLFGSDTITPAIEPTGTDRTLRIRTPGTGFLLMGNHGRDHFAVGTSADTVVVNRLRAIGAATGGVPGIIAEGADTDIDIQVTAKGGGLLRLGTPVDAVGATATDVFRVKSSAGVVYELLARRVV